MFGDQASPAPQPRKSAGNPIVTIGGVILAIGGLYFGKDFFIPFTLAALLAFALSPIVNWLIRRYVPRIAAVLVASFLAFSLISGLAYVVTNQLIGLADQLPTYRQTIVEKVQSIRGTGKGGGHVVDRLMTTLEGMGQALEKPAQEESVSGNDQTASARQPLSVRIEPPDRSPLDVLLLVLGPIVAGLARAGIVVVFVIFVLLEKEDIRDRFIKLVGQDDLPTSTEALSEAGSRVSRYLLMQLIVNVTYGVPIGIGLMLIGVPNAVLWGLLAAVLRFVPFLGPFLAALMPAALAFAISPGWTMLAMVIGLFVVMELISNNVIEPWLYGTSTGLSSLAIISAAIFWTSLWGPIGLVLATPLTVCLVVLGRYVPQLQFFELLLGNKPVLTTEQRLYQRLLAANTEEATEIAEAYVAEHSLLEFCDRVAIPALLLAENDRHRSVNDTGFKYIVADGMSLVVGEVGAQKKGSILRPTLQASGGQAQRGLRYSCLCIGGRTDLDAATAAIVSHAIGELGIRSKALPAISVSQHGIGQLDLAGVDVVCLSYLATDPQTYARFVSRRLKQRNPALKIVVCLWNPAQSQRQATDLTERMAADAMVFTVADAATQIKRWVARDLSDPMLPAPIPENETARLGALKRLGLLSSESKRFDEVAARVSATFGTPIALVTLIDEKYQRWPGAVGLDPRLNACRLSARDTSICGHVVAANDILIIEDVAKDARFANNPFLLENGIRFYAGAPLTTKAGYAVGSLCVIDIKPRSFSERDQSLLRTIAADLMERVEEECRTTRPKRNTMKRRGALQLQQT